MGRYGQISVLHILSLLHIFVAQSEARGFINYNVLSEFTGPWEILMTF